ncbi:DUF411 domain-containing protein [Mesorhizobium sp.]|uniref:DUF411 domain-containing protein n=1 Tax=Mesorhizobium sp. TaxID=1871066 RepID=UPI00257FA4AA|nr:DUF411 domain-containing protein [Mesorhizobium sp.]
MSSPDPVRRRSGVRRRKDVTLYNPQCGCCEGYAGYLQETASLSPSRPTHDLFAMSREEGIPPEADGCLLSFIDGYVVSGHVPVGTVNKLLTERPDINGHDAARHADGLPRHEWHEGSALRDSRNPEV